MNIPKHVFAIFTIDDYDYNEKAFKKFAFLIGQDRTFENCNNLCWYPYLKTNDYKLFLHPATGTSEIKKNALIIPYSQFDEISFRYIGNKDFIILNNKQAYYELIKNGPINDFQEKAKTLARKINSNIPVLFNEI